MSGIRPVPLQPAKSGCAIFGHHGYPFAHLYSCYRWDKRFNRQVPLSSESGLHLLLHWLKH
jgi:hypothetical protein